MHSTRVERVIQTITSDLQNLEEEGERICSTIAADCAADVSDKQQKKTLNSLQADKKNTTIDTLFLQQIIDNYTDPLRQAIAKLQRKLLEPTQKKFYLQRRVAHLLPLTNICFDRSGTRCLTGSYDRICRIINTHDAVEQQLLKGHDNVVFSVAFNQPKWYYLQVMYVLWLINLTLLASRQRQSGHRFFRWHRACVASFEWPIVVHALRP